MCRKIESRRFNVFDKLDVYNCFSRCINIKFVEARNAVVARGPPVIEFRDLQHDIQPHDR